MPTQPERVRSGFDRIRVRVPGQDPGIVERVAAEAWGAGAAGVEEQSNDGGTLLLIYAESPASDAICEAVRETLGVPGVVVEGIEGVDDTDWSEEWKRELAAVVISERLVVRPSFVPSPGPHAINLVIDPGQAFGTGGHASTRLALECIDDLSRRGWLQASTKVLDVGVGSGVLAMAALALGAGWAVGHDLDPLAAPEARRMARVNDLEPGLAVFTGPLAALRPAKFDLVLANLLRSEMLPIAAGIAGALKPSGVLILSGLLEEELETVATTFESLGLRRAAQRTCGDPTGDAWGALLLGR